MELGSDQHRLDRSHGCTHDAGPIFQWSHASSVFRGPASVTSRHGTVGGRYASSLGIERAECLGQYRWPPTGLHLVNQGGFVRVWSITLTPQRRSGLRPVATTGGSDTRPGQCSGMTPGGEPRWSLTTAAHRIARALRADRPCNLVEVRHCPSARIFNDAVDAHEGGFDQLAQRDASPFPPLGRPCHGSTIGRTSTVPPSRAAGICAAKSRARSMSSASSR